MAAQNGSTIEGMIGGVPGVRTFGLSTNQPVDFTGSSAVALPASGISKGVIEIINFVGQTTEAATDRTIFIATQACQVIACSESHGVAAGGASALQLSKETGTTAPGAGTDLLTSTGFDLNATANTVQVGTLIATTATLTLAAGDRLSLDWANAIGTSAGICVTVTIVTV